MRLSDTQRSALGLLRSIWPYWRTAFDINVSLRTLDSLHNQTLIERRETGGPDENRRNTTLFRITEKAARYLDARE